MVDFGKLKLANIYSIFETLSRIQNTDRHYVKTEYSRNNQNFETTVSFLRDIRFLKYSNDRIILTKRTDSFIEDNKIKRKKLKSEIISLLAWEIKKYQKLIINYINMFSEIDGKLIHRPSMDERIIYSSLRNFLIEIGLINHSRKNNNYYLNNKYYEVIKMILPSRKKLTPKKLKKIQEENEKIGLKAELEVLEYEEKRLSKYPNLVQNIIHIASRDVSAGYDILSWELKNNKGKKVPRYIEVKAVRVDDYCFYWSRNEINKAKELNVKYYLYLVPVVGNMVFSMDKLEIISNPIKNVFNNSTKWNRQEELYILSKTGNG